MKKSLEKKLKKLNVAIVTHIFATGPALDLEKYLSDRVSSLTFIGHPFSFSKDISSYKRFYFKGKLVINYKAWKIKLPTLLMYFKDAFLTFWWILRSERRIDLYIGSDGFVAYLGLLLKRMGKVREVVLYTIDFVPTRFENFLLNRLYHYFDEQCLKNCKVIWNLSSKMAEGREEYMKVKRSAFAPQITVPLGIWEKRIPKVSFGKRKRYRIVFMGHILKKQGLDIVIDSLPAILKKLPETELLVIGTGEYEDNLKMKVKKLQLERNVTFAGYIEKHEDIEKMLSESMVSVATYKPDQESFTYFADPGKIKNYLAAGLPVILTNVPPIAREIELKKCAIIIGYNEREFMSSIVELLARPSKLRQYSKNAFRYAKNFDWDNIFPVALERALS